MGDRQMDNDGCLDNVNNNNRGADTMTQTQRREVMEDGGDLLILTMFRMQFNKNKIKPQKRIRSLNKNQEQMRQNSLPTSDQRSNPIN